MQYGASDAEKIANIFTERGSRLFNKVNTILLTDEDATKANILNGLDYIIKNSNPEDVVIIFFAGHGIVIELEFSEGRKDNVYHFIPYEMKGITNSDIEKYGISSIELQNKLAKIPSLNLAIILDTCHSSEEEIARLGNFLKAFVISSSSSYEHKELESGILAYSILEYINNDNNIIYISEIASYVENRVFELSKIMGINLFPVIQRTGNDFPVAGSGN